MFLGYVPFFTFFMSLLSEMSLFCPQYVPSMHLISLLRPYCMCIFERIYYNSNFFFFFLGCSNFRKVTESMLSAKCLQGEINFFSFFSFQLFLEYWVKVRIAENENNRQIMKNQLQTNPRKLVDIPKNNQKSRRPIKIRG